MLPSNSIQVFIKGSLTRRAGILQLPMSNTYITSPSASRGALLVFLLSILVDYCPLPYATHCIRFIWQLTLQVYLPYKTNSALKKRENLVLRQMETISIRASVASTARPTETTVSKPVVAKGGS